MFTSREFLWLEVNGYDRTAGLPISLLNLPRSEMLAALKTAVSVTALMKDIPEKSACT